MGGRISINIAVLSIVLLFISGLAGCLSDADDRDSGDNSTETVEETESRQKQCIRGSQEGQVTLDSQLSAEAKIDLEPAEGQITYQADLAVGTIDLVLDRDGTEVWSESVSIVDGANTYQVSDLEAGNYTLTASTDAGFAQSQIELLLEWGDGECE